MTSEAVANGLHRARLEPLPAGISPAERAARGKAARAAVPRDSHAVFQPADPPLLVPVAALPGAQASAGLESHLNGSSPTTAAPWSRTGSSLSPGTRSPTWRGR
jgi:hypothetical protein